MGIPQTPTTARTPSAAPDTVTVRFLLDLAGTRTFHCPSGRSYRFDARTARAQRVRTPDAQFLVQRHPQAFRIEGV